MFSMIAPKGISTTRFFCAFGWLLLSMTSEMASAQESSCQGGERYVCANYGTVTIINVQAQDSTKAVSSTAIFRSPKPTVVDTGNFKFKLLGCKSSEDRVQCDLIVNNLTSLDRTLFVASKQQGGIANRAITNLIGDTTLIDSNGASYVAEAVSFAGNSGAETGQSYFTVYSGTTPKLSVLFTGVETPATIQRLDLVVGEYVKSKNTTMIAKLRYTVNPNIQSGSTDLQGEPQQSQSVLQQSSNQSQPPSNQTNPQQGNNDVFGQVGGFLRSVGDVKRSLNNILH